MSRHKPECVSPSVFRIIQNSLKFFNIIRFCPIIFVQVAQHVFVHEEGCRGIDSVPIPTLPYVLLKGNDLDILCDPGMYQNVIDLGKMFPAIHHDVVGAILPTKGEDILPQMFRSYGRSDNSK
jgi:hypothetical protein